MMHTNDCYDKNWELLRQGDRQALLLLFDEHYVGLLNYGIRLTCDKECVRDAITDLLIHLWDKRATLPTVENTRSYLLTCLHRRLIAQQCAERKRQQHSSRMQQEEHEELSYEDYIVKVQAGVHARQQLKRALQRLTAREKELLQLRFFEDLDYETIAERCGICKRTAYNLIYAALQRMREELAVPGREESINFVFFCISLFVLVDMTL